jgi:hypothetical protein
MPAPRMVPIQQANSPARLEHKRAALVVAHPGHELRVHGWLERVRPLVMMLTDGSGNTGRPRLSSSVRLLESAGASWTAPFCRLADRELYRAIIDGEHALFVGLAEEIAESLVRSQIDYVVGDAAEGFNPGHDVCRHLIDTAVALAERYLGHPIANYDFLLEGCDQPTPADTQAGVVRLRLTQGELARKWAAAQEYAELKEEVQRLVGRLGMGAFRTECLRRVQPFATDFCRQTAPFYEAHGRSKVADGQYEQVLLYEQHLRPLIEALRQFAGEHSPCPA